MMIQYIGRGSDAHFYFFLTVSRTGLQVGPSVVFVAGWPLCCDLQLSASMTQTEKLREGHGYVTPGFVTRGSQFSGFILRCVFSQKQSFVNPTTSLFMHVCLCL